MSLVNGIWHDPELDPPRGELENKTVLIVKENKVKERTINFGAYMVYSDGHGEWTTNNGKGKVLWWMPLPKIPEIPEKG